MKKNYLMRLAWNIIYTLFFKFSPRPFHRWRSLLLRLFGTKTGRSCHVYPRAEIWAPWNLELGDCACIADNAIIYNQAPVYIGEKAAISQGAHLCTGTHDYRDPKFPLIAKPIKIEKNAWICAEAFILPGVTIGEGAVIGARSVVTKDMPAWSVCAGNPCRVIKKRIAHSA